MSFINDITPEPIRRLVPYSSAKRELLNSGYDGSASQSIWLNANESPYDNIGDSGKEPSAANAFSADRPLNRYPDFQPSELITRYAAYAGVKPDQVLVTRGADEGIELLVRTFCSPGQDRILINPPTYGMYNICATTFNVATIKVPLTNEYQLDVEQIVKQTVEQRTKETGKQESLPPKLIFICSPNNPTGQLIAQAQIISVLDAYRDSALVVVDEAYIEFCGDSSVAHLIAQYQNLVVLRTLSKAFALAGIRCGFTLAQADTIGMLQKVIAPYPVPAPVEQIALQALSEQGIEQMQQQVAQLNRQKSDFIQQLGTLPGIRQIISSDANFVLMRLTDKTALLAAMNKHNILIRDQSNQPTLADCVRISIGSEAEMQAVLDVFKGNAQ